MSDTLDEAWKAAEAALPSKWRLAGMWRINDEWTATALEIPRHRGPGLGRAGDAQGSGPTPIAALDALTAALRKEAK